MQTEKQMIANAIKNHNYVCGTENSIESIESFHNNLGKILRDLKIIRETKKMNIKTLIPRKIRKAILLKIRLVEGKKNKLIYENQIREIQKYILKKINEHRKSFFKKYICQGIKYLDRKIPEMRGNGLKKTQE